MVERTDGNGDCALSSVYEVRQACSKGYLLGLALSASIWGALCFATTISTTSSLVPELSNTALTQHVQESSAHGGVSRLPLFEVRFE